MAMQGQSQGQQGQQKKSPEQKAEQVGERVAERAQSTFESARERITTQFTAVARAIESATNTLEREQQSDLSQRVQPLIRKAENASQYLRNKSPRELKDDLDGFARQRTGWFLGGAFLLGLFSARFLKSSEQAAVSS